MLPGSPPNQSSGTPSSGSPYHPRSPLIPSLINAFKKLPFVRDITAASEARRAAAARQGGDASLGGTRGPADAARVGGTARVSADPSEASWSVNEERSQPGGGVVFSSARVSADPMGARWRVEEERPQERGGIVFGTSSGGAGAGSSGATADGVKTSSPSIPAGAAATATEGRGDWGARGGRGTTSGVAVPATVWTRAGRGDAGVGSGGGLAGSGSAGRGGGGGGVVFSGGASGDSMLGAMESGRQSSSASGSNRASSDSLSADSLRGLTFARVAGKRRGGSGGSGGGFAYGGGKFGVGGLASFDRSSSAGGASTPLSPRPEESGLAGGGGGEKHASPQSNFAGPPRKQHAGSETGVGNITPTRATRGGGSLFGEAHREPDAHRPAGDFGGDSPDGNSPPGFERLTSRGKSGAGVHTSGADHRTEPGIQPGIRPRTADGADELRPRIGGDASAAVGIGSGAGPGAVFGSGLDRIEDGVEGLDEISPLSTEESPDWVRFSDWIVGAESAREGDGDGGRGGRGGFLEGTNGESINSSIYGSIRSSWSNSSDATGSNSLHSGSRSPRSPMRSPPPQQPPPPP